MDSLDLTSAQLDELFLKLAPMSHYVRKIENRMRHECFPADDELTVLVEQAAAAMHRLAIRATFGWLLQTILRPVNAQGFVVLPKRCIVERTFAWLARYRRHAKDYERNPETSEAMIYIAMINLMSWLLAHKKLI
jgi:hypothetical protein